jgi:glycerophosphoryl diester phosphodiesterase
MGITIWTHRGNPGAENALSGFQLAWENGINHFETDLQLTKDGVLVLSHDPDLTRITGNSDHIRDLTLNQLQLYPIAGTDPWCTFEELINHFPLGNISIDLKSDETVYPFIEMAKSYNYENWVVGSFSSDRIKAVRNALPDIKTALTPQEVLLMMLGRTPEGLTKGLHFAMVPPKQYGLPIVTKRFVKKCKSLDIKIFVWTINNEIEYQRMKTLEVDGVITDHHSILLANTQHG